MPVPGIVEPVYTGSFHLRAGVCANDSPKQVQRLSRPFRTTTSYAVPSRAARETARTRRARPFTPDQAKGDRWAADDRRDSQTWAIGHPTVRPVRPETKKKPGSKVRVPCFGGAPTVRVR